MCGLSGALLHAPSLGADEFLRRLARMSGTLRHRGPDHEAGWSDGVIGLGHNRLSIIDRSAAAHQPLADATGRIRIVTNGEIYNFRELREELEGRGRRFLTRSDTEVVAAGYECWGMDVFPRLRGMFAIALWDSSARRLVLARDRIGKKPLHIARAREAFLFASESKAILAWPDFPKAPNGEAIHRYLAFHYVPEPLTAFEGIERVAPGHVLVVEAGREPRPERFADWPPPSSRSARPDETKEIRERVDDAVRARLVSDVPVGAFLSGGIDSSVVASAMVRQTGSNVHTFSVGFEEAPFDERPFARAMSARLGTRHHEVTVRPSDLDVAASLAWYYGDPFGDSSALPTYMLAKAARTEVGVVLSGDGGDELFLGYDSYRWHMANRWVEAVPAAIRRGAAAIDEAVPERTDEDRVRRVLRRCARRVGWPAWRSHAQMAGAFRPIDRAAGYGDALRPWREDDPAAAWARWFAAAPDAIGGAAWCDLNTYLPQDILVKVDVATMAHGLEVRSPLLDQDLVGHVMALPSGARMRDGRTKGLLIDAFRSDLPDLIVDRPKRGFSIPLEDWLRGPWEASVRETLLDARAQSRGLYADGFVERILNAHRGGHALHHPRIWSMWMLELWFRSWMDRGTDAAIEGPIAL